MGALRSCCALRKDNRVEPKKTVLSLKYCRSLRENFIWLLQIQYKDRQSVEQQRSERKRTCSEQRAAGSSSLSRQFHCRCSGQTLYWPPHSPVQNHGGFFLLASVSERKRPTYRFPSSTQKASGTNLSLHSLKSIILNSESSHSCLNIFFLFLR